jgi:DNA-binding MarR family transcriptional regulator
MEIDHNLLDDKVIHERSRFLILMKLASQPGRKMSFSDLKDVFGFTSGNLSTHLRILEEAGYIFVEKSFKNKKPLTTLVISEFGLKELDDYLISMEKLINSFKN